MLHRCLILMNCGHPCPWCNTHQSLHDRTLYGYMRASTDIVTGHICNQIDSLLTQYWHAHLLAGMACDRNLVHAADCRDAQPHHCQHHGG